MALRLIIEDFEGSTTIVPLEQDPVTIGRKEGNTIQLTEKNVSRSHAKLDHGDDGWTIRDLGSYNGVTVNGVVIDETVALREGDIITIGDYSLVLHDDVGKKTVDLDRPLRAANQAQAKTLDTGPMLASSSQDLPRLSPSEIEALSTDSLPPMTDPVVDEPPASSNRGAIIGIVVVALALVCIGGYVLLGPPSQAQPDGEAAVVDGAGTPADDPAPDDGAGEAGEAGEAVVPAETGAGAVMAETGAPDAETGDPALEETPEEAPAEPEAPAESDDAPEEATPSEPDEGDTGSAKPQRNKKKGVTPEEADALLADARKASMAGELNKAYKLAKQSYSGKKSADALKVMAVSACKMGSASKAKAAYSKMSSGKDAVQKLCASHGIAL